jgi:hypothetical protein
MGRASDSSSTVMSSGELPSPVLALRQLLQRGDKLAEIGAAGADFQPS